jgi:hypothetical protein
MRETALRRYENFDKEAGRKLVERACDENILAQIAKETRCDDTAIAAIEKIKNKELLKQLACENYIGKRSCKAVEQISDENTLAEIAKSAYEFRARETAVKKIENEGLLLKIAAENNKDDYWILDKIMQFSDGEERLKELVMSQKGNTKVYYNVLTRLAKKANDPNTLYFCFSQDPYCSKHLIDKIDDIAFLEKKLLEDSNKKCRSGIIGWAMERLSDAALLSYALRTDNEKNKRCDVAVELMKREASRYSQPLATLINECLHSQRVLDLAELKVIDNFRLIPALEAMACKSEKDHILKRNCCEELGRIQTKASIEALMRIMQKNHEGGTFARETLIKIYRETKDDAARETILKIPQRVYHEHSDKDKGNNNCNHIDDSAVHFDLSM